MPTIRVRATYLQKFISEWIDVEAANAAEAWDLADHLSFDNFEPADPEPDWTFEVEDKED